MGATATANAATVQFNVRIDEALKNKGDRVFASVGLTPTKAVRALYKLAVRNTNHPEVLAEALGVDEAEKLDEECQAKLKVAEEGRQIIPNALAAMGITDYQSPYSDDPNERAQQYKEIAHQAAWEKYCA